MTHTFVTIKLADKGLIVHIFKHRYSSNEGENDTVIFD